MAKSRRKTITPSEKQKQYSRELGALKTRIKNAEKLGYDFPENMVPSERPKRITKQAIERLHSLRGEELYKKAILAPSQHEIQYRNELRKLERRIKTAEKLGFDYPEHTEDILPQLPHEISQKDVDYIRSLRGEKLYERALVYHKPEDEFYIEEPLPPSAGIEIVKQKKKEQAITNLSKRKSRINIDEAEVDGVNLLNEYNSLSPSEQAKFIRSLSDEDFELFTRAQQKYGGKENVRQTDLGTGRQTGEPVLQDEGTQYAEDEEGTHEEYYSEPERPVTPSAEELERKKANEEITDQKVKQWKESYERQKKLKKKDREYIYDGDAIYAGILSRIEQFESDYNANPERFKRGANKQWSVSFKHMLNNEIRIEGFNNVMRRLDGHGIEIDTALEVLLYDSNENKVSAAMSQLAEIIKGRKLNQQESQEITAISEAFNYDEADEALERFQIDELT